MFPARPGLVDVGWTDLMHLRDAVPQFPAWNLANPKVALARRVMVVRRLTPPYVLFFVFIHNADYSKAVPDLVQEHCTVRH